MAVGRAGRAKGCLLASFVGLLTISVSSAKAEEPPLPAYSSAFGTYGGAPGQLRSPGDIAIDAQGNLWIANKGSHRIEKFDAAGNFIDTYGTQGAGDGQFNRPASVAVDSEGNVLIADSNNHRIQKLNSEGKYLSKFGTSGSGNGQFNKPEEVVVDAAGNIWVADVLNGRVQKFNSKGEFLKVLDSGQLYEPKGLDIDPSGNVWVSDWQKNRISVFDSEGEFIVNVGSAGSGNGQFNRPDAIEIDAEGNVWVGDALNNRIQRFDLTGKYLDQFGSAGSGKGQLALDYPMGIATDGKGRLWLTDVNNHRVQEWRGPLALITPETTITSPQPSYTSGEKPQITFTADLKGATFLCGLDADNEIPTTPCTSPYSLPENLGSGWHTFTVAAVNPAGIPDPSPAKWQFNPAIYPDAPAASRLTSPEEGYTSSSHYTLKAKWGDLGGSGNVSALTFQWKLSGWKEFRTIPAEFVTDAKGQQVSWPLPIASGPGESSPVFFDAEAYRKQNNMSEVVLSEDTKFRAVFDGSPGAAGASQPVDVGYERKWGSPTNATEAVGPATLDLLSGHFTINRTDVSIPVPGYEANLEFGRTYESAGISTGINGKSFLLGYLWQPSVPVQQAYEGHGWTKIMVRHENAIPAQYEEECWEGECEQWLVEDEIPAADWAELLDNEGGGIAFDLVGGGYVAPEYAKEFKLTKEGNTFTLADPDGTRTVFVQNEVGVMGEYRPSSVSWQATPKDARMVYEKSGGAYHRLRMMIAPAAAGVTCDDSPGSGNYAPITPGCRTLTFQYTNSPQHYIYDRLTSITYHNATGSNSQIVAKYAYNEKGSLIAAWDPRISPNLKEQYTYNDAWDNDLTTVTPPGEEPWEFEYYDYKYPAALNGKLRSVNRASLLEDPEVATTTVVYDVPIEGEDAPYDMSPSTVAEWGQADYPVNATAIFPPDQVPEDESPSDYSRAGVYYMDPDGYLVNSASAAPPGVEGDAIETSETDQHGNIVRALSAQARLGALAEEDPLARSEELATKATYSADGTELLRELGPLHEIKLESGPTVEARALKTIEYDNGAPTPPTGTPMPHLPTRETVEAEVPGIGWLLEQRVTETKYNWNLRKPTETVVDPNGLGLRTRIVYDEATGLPTERRLPANPEGGDARSTKFLYYTKNAHPTDSACGNNAALANLPCKTLPAAQPSGSNPKLLVTRYAAYSFLDQPTSVIDSPGGDENASKRTTTITYDAAGRQVKSKQAGGGASIPATETLYSSTTGMPVTQQFVCEAPQSCGGFDSQAVTTTYDTLGRVTSYEDADGNTSGTAYDLLNRPVVVTDGKGAQTMTYDEVSGVLVGMEDTAAGVFTASYDADGNIVEQTLPNGLAAQTTYDEAGSPVHLRYEKTTNCVSSCTWLEFDVEESVHGQWLEQASTLSSQEYAYDKAGRLTLVKDFTAGGACTTRSYTFDANSNRTKLVTRSPKVGGACDTESAGTPQTYGYDSGDRLIGEGVSYDDFGRITNLPAAYAGGGTLSTSYFANDLVRSQTQDGTTNTYELDASMRQRRRVRTGGEAGTEIYHYASGSDSPVWIDEGSSWIRNIGALGGLSAIQHSEEGTVLQLPNLHGDIVATASLDPEAAELLATFEFDEFGNPKGETTPKYGWLGGKQRRTELPSGVIQMGVRSYVPAMGRFIGVDPVVGGSANAYEYSYGDPVNKFDLDGRAACSVTPLGAGARATDEGSHVVVSIFVQGGAVCSRNARDRSLAVQITGGYILPPIPGRRQKITPQSSSTSCPRLRCEHSVTSSVTIPSVCNVNATGKVYVQIRASWRPRRGHQRRSVSLGATYRVNAGKRCIRR